MVVLWTRWSSGGREDRPVWGREPCRGRGRGADEGRQVLGNQVGQELKGLKY